MTPRLVTAIAIICACLAGTVVATVTLHRGQERAASDAAAEADARAANRVIEIVNGTSQALIGAAALFDASERVEPREFAAYSRHLIADPAVTAIAYLEAVDAGERAEWEERNGVVITDIDDPDTRAPARPQYFPTTFIQSETTAPRFGVDLATNAIRRDAILRAIETGSPQLTPPIDLLSSNRGLIMYYPVYAGPDRPIPSDERLERAEGVVVGVYRTGTLGNSVARGLRPDRSVEILDEGELVTQVGPALAPEQTTSTRIDVAGRTWEIRSGPVPATNLWPAVGAATGGLALTLAILALLLVLSRRERSAQDEARRRALAHEEAVQARDESEERYRTLVGTMADGVIVRGADGRVVTANASAERILHLDRGQLQNGGLDNAPQRRFVNEAGEPLDRSQLPSIRALESGLPNGPTVIGVTGTDGGTTWLSVSAEPMAEPGDEGGRTVVSCFSDITERVNSHQLLRRERDHSAALIDAMQDGMILTDADGVITEVNRRFCAMTGYTEEQITGTSPPYPFWPDDAQQLSQLSENLSAGWGGELDSAYRRADGAVLPVIIAASPMREDDGRLSGVLMTVKDATERDRVDRAKDEFVSVVSHELRTPLTSIHGALGVLSEGQGDRLDDTGRHLLDIATRNTDRLSHLINHVLDLEQITSGKDRGEFQRSSVAVLINQAADLLGPLAAENSVRFEVTPVDDALAVFCDPDRIAQVLTNFLSNAIKFSPGGSTVTIDAGRVGSEVEFRVRDQGRGIPDDELERIFERFHQVDSTDRRLAGGAGLGLAISQRIAELHDGRVWAESTIDVGSTFILALPAATATTPAGTGGAGPDPNHDQVGGQVTNRR